VLAANTLLLQKNYEKLQKTTKAWSYLNSKISVKRPSFYSFAEEEEC
jgi:hypothetical protein